MYPTSAFGFLLIAAAVLLAIRPERRFVPIALSLGVATLGSGVISTCVGVVKTFHYLGQVEPPKRMVIAALGCAESLHNAVLALILVVLSALLAAVGACRAARLAPAPASSD
jgi:hypothetical protein